ncbi:MAG: RNA polymerase sigma factor [Acidimicrobiales bacterium]
MARRPEPGRPKGSPRPPAPGGAGATSQSFPALVERARDNDPDAWEALFARCYPRLLAYTSRRLSSSEQAEDAVAETISRAVANIDQLRNEGAGFDAWMYGIARHVVLDAHRRGSRERL